MAATRRHFCNSKEDAIKIYMHTNAYITTVTSSKPNILLLIVFSIFSVGVVGVNCCGVVQAIFDNNSVRSSGTDVRVVKG